MTCSWRPSTVAAITLHPSRIVQPRAGPRTVSIARKQSRIIQSASIAHRTKQLPTSSTPIAPACPTANPSAQTIRTAVLALRTWCAHGAPPQRPASQNPRESFTRMRRTGVSTALRKRAAAIIWIATRALLNPGTSTTKNVTGVLTRRSVSRRALLSRPVRLQCV